MSTLRNHWLTSRLLASCVLAVFLTIPPFSAALQTAREMFPVPGGQATAKTDPSPSTPSRLIKQGWPRKGLPRFAATAEPVSINCQKLEDHQKLWTFIAPLPPTDGGSLDYCAEFTKPASLCIRSMGTPQNHRAPPAPLL